MRNLSVMKTHGSHSMKGKMRIPALHISEAFSNCITLWNCGLWFRKSWCILYLNFRYRRWSLGRQPDGTEVRLVCRTEHDGVSIGPNGETQTLTIKAFNEWDSRVSFFALSESPVNSFLLARVWKTPWYKSNVKVIWLGIGKRGKRQTDIFCFQNSHA